MDFQLSEDQEALVSALQSILQDHAELPQAERFSYSYFNADLQRLLGESGFLGAARDIGPLEAALVTIETARLPVLVETAATGLVAPMLLPADGPVDGPVALIAGGAIGKAHRNLPIARTALVDLGEDVAVLTIDPADVEPVASILAYPYGRFRAIPDLAAARRLPGAGARLRQWWRVALAAEVAGAAQAALDFTLDYVKQRQVFGRPVGSFQSVQHRLVQCHAHAQSTYYLALRAAWSGEAVDADCAASLAQQGVQKLLFDLHQFHGGMGVTTEHLLHFWLYRIRALQAEAGGVHGIGLEIAGRMWPAATQATGADAAPQIAEAG
ncbi:acyl-CoA dehydrogenase [Flavisphingomonas formosensis]|uniref:acyl-CoA dehydrogenase n=1 Tax=Flavisphingomonas formosensis TaxID=861534 RepID=UPI0012FA10FA|nr:acyl-CoA dehydrogenase [Sphingomonas formosensis]